MLSAIPAADLRAGATVHSGPLPPLGERPERGGALVAERERTNAPESEAPAPKVAPVGRVQPALWRESRAPVLEACVPPGFGHDLPKLAQIGVAPGA